ncbi:Gfo/Idh/MocA family protein [Microbacterium yannicii]|uniref:Gfo/Idh/MocA family protein n=1 Tax=Microbacterium yannicii TaxID=671622 RepID=UPI00031E8587|nr:Gfo/Idh/MocA family oxidoreductase [Microbacterium yannicii]
MADGSQRTVAVALVGLGNSGRHYHLPHIRNDPRFELRAVATATGGPAETFGVPWHRGWEGLLEDPGIELVVIATPHHLHHGIAAPFLDRGVSVLVEKPLTVTTAEADDLLSRATASGAVLAVHHQRRWEEDFVALKELVDRGDIGVPWRVVASRGHQNQYVASTPDRPHAGDSVLEWTRSRRYGGGVMRVIGPHPVDHVLQLAATPPQYVSARVAHEGGEDVESWAGIEIDFGRALSGRVEVFRRQGPPVPRFAVWGDEGAAVATDGTRILVRPHRGASFEVDRLTAPGVLGEQVYDDLFAAVRTGAPLRATAAQGRAVVRLIETAEQSADQQGAWVQVNDQKAPRPL